MDQAAQRVQTTLLQTVEDHVERRAFFADEQDPLAFARVVGDQVGDGLRFACAGRALDDETAPVTRQPDGGVLGGVGRHHVPALTYRQRGGWRGLDVARLDREHAVERRVRIRGIDQLGVVADQRHLLVIEVDQADLRQIQVPRIAVAFGFLQIEADAFGFLSGIALHHLRMARAGDRCRTRFEPLRQRTGTDPALEQRAAQRTVIVALVAVVGKAWRRGARHAGGTTSPLVLLQALQGFLPDQPDLRFVDQSQLHGRLGALDLREQVGMDVCDRRFLQIDRLGQTDVVELAQLVAQHGIELRLAVGSLQRILVAHALASRQFDGQPQQRGDDALLRRLLQVVPAQERDDQAQVAEAVFGAVAARFLDQLVQGDRQIRLVLEPQPALQVDRAAGDDVGGERIAPRADVFRPDAVQLQHQRHAGHGQVDAAGGRLEVEEAVAAR